MFFKVLQYLIDLQKEDKLKIRFITYNNINPGEDYQQIIFKVKGRVFDIICGSFERIWYNGANNYIELESLKEEIETTLGD